MKTFETILIDFPWPEKGGGKIKRGADRHYPVLKVADALPIILGTWARGNVGAPEKDCHLYF